MLQVDVASWVLGWHFGGGERISNGSDVFGDAGKQGVHLFSTGASAAGAAPPAGVQQAVAITSERA